MEVKCKICGKSFNGKITRIKKGQSKYCSFSCWKLSFKKNILKCNYCGIDFTRKGSEIRKNKTGYYYCSVKCFKKNSEPKKRICKQCGAEFNAIPYRVDIGRANYCSRQCVVASQKTIRSSIEIALEKELINRGVDFVAQYPIIIAKTVVDFFIKPDIVIYADGDYWHRREGMAEKDSKQNYMLVTNGYKVYRFWEHEINNNVVGCVDKIKDIK